jgi:hypothetical protein
MLTAPYICWIEVFVLPYYDLLCHQSLSRTRLSRRPLFPLDVVFLALQDEQQVLYLRTRTDPQINCARTFVPLFVVSYRGIA